MDIRLNRFLNAFSELLSFSVYNYYSSARGRSISRNHNRNVALAANEIAGRMNMTLKQRKMLYLTAVIHDNGMVGEEFVQRSSMEEIGLSHYESMVKHCISGESNVRGLSFYKEIRNTIICHHENWDGSGFFGAMAEEIPLFSQVIRLADELDLNFDFKHLAERKEEALAYVARNTGGLFSPRVSVAGMKWLRTVTQETLDGAEDRVPAMRFRFDWDRFENFADILMRIIDHKSQFTFTHSHSVSRHADEMGALLGFDPIHRAKLRIAAKLHDLGKIRISNTILEKPGRLNQEQYHLIQAHCRIGEEVLSTIPQFKEIALWAGQHHEKLDGSGYPDRLTGEAILLESRILCICDVFVAMTEDRPYRSEKTAAEALAILEDMAGEGKIDASLFEVFKETMGGVARFR